MNWRIRDDCRTYISNANRIFAKIKIRGLKTDMERMEILVRLVHSKTLPNYWNSQLSVAKISFYIWYRLTFRNIIFVVTFRNKKSLIMTEIYFYYNLANNIKDTSKFSTQTFIERSYKDNKEKQIIRTKSYRATT